MGYITSDNYTLQTGMLLLTNGHSMYWQEWGNKDAKIPVYVLHGGPGGGTKDRYKLNYDPQIHKVVFFDQRGCGQSLPTGNTSHNTTQDLIADIEALRIHLGHDKISLSGGSWGSCLALCYAIAYPKTVHKMLLGGIYTGTKAENNYIQQGGLKTHYPEAWQQYVEAVPEEFKNNTVEFYNKQFSAAQPNPDYVRRWNILEGSAMSIDGDYLADSAVTNEEVDEAGIVHAKLESHYFVNDCFLPDGYILQNAKKISHIPTIFVQGRHDHVCPPQTAYALQQAMGSNCKLHIVPGSHAYESSMREVTRAYAFAFLAN